MAWLTVLQFIVVVTVVVYFGSNLLSLVRVRPAAPPLPRMPFVSICVPARNEERDIEACLTSLLTQDYPEFEVIVVDDHSTDRTSEIIHALQEKHPRLKSIQSAPLPEGWYGKPFALHQASQVANGKLLLFTDADPVFEPHALASAVHFMQLRRLDLLTLMPRALFGSFWERAVQPVVFGLIAGLSRFRKIADPNDPHAMGFGAFILITRDLYRKMGGHEAVRARILEDISLARVAKQNGGRVLAADGKRLFSIRMYHSLKEIWEGWRKNVFLAFKQSIPKTVYYAAMILGFTVTPWLVVVANAAVDAPAWVQAVSTVALLIVLFTEVSLCEELELSGWCIWIFPLGGLVVCGILFNSMIHVLFKKQSMWRGRRYASPT
ncbi:putative Glycosyl transferase [Nitrospina gracilis 3/211]|uniref:Putative Glycosyl transferase n=2 Tax=Nitrospina TaxID=35800 RepID=M1Z286_NITG3|nr:glycosyltransferase [Nitrospina gracilis]CCQ92107.1 putative Glycosyl transferase [Nitrospina gracilis 3/211]